MVFLTVHMKHADTKEVWEEEKRGSLHMRILMTKMGEDKKND